MKAYYVKYKMDGSWSKEKGICVPANSKAEAYDTAVYEMIPEIESHSPYSAWVDNVTYNNGNVRYFNTSEGNAY